MALWLAGTADAAFDRGIYGQPCRGNIFSAVATISVIVFCDAPQSRVDTLETCLTLEANSFGHCLALKGIHPGKASDALLVKLDRTAPVRRRCVNCFQGRFFGLQTSSNVVQIQLWVCVQCLILLALQSLGARKFICQARFL